jgi:hypothetical protein
MLSVSARALAALAALLSLSGCALGPSGTLQVREHPSPSPIIEAQPTNSFVIDGGSVFGILQAPTARVSCTAGGRDVQVTGVVQGQQVTMDLSQLRPRQDLYDPPLKGGFADSVTMTLRRPGAASPVEYAAGFLNGDYQGVGTLVVGRTGRTGAVNLSFGPPLGQEPSVQSSGNSTTFGANSGSVEGRWSCP